MNRVCCLLGLVFLAILTGCGPDDTAMPAATTTKETTSTGTPEDIMDIADFERLDVGTYYIDPDGDSLLLCVSCTGLQPMAGRNGSER
jgi:hypothetical protein